MTTFITRSTDLVDSNVGEPAYTFFVDNETYTIAANVLVSSTAGLGPISVDVTHDNASLLNYGTIYTPLGIGVFSDSAHSIVNNVSDASIIAGGNWGIYIEQGSNVTIDNRGSIFGYTFGGIDLTSDITGGVKVSNFGTVYGHERGIENFADVFGGNLSNTDILNAGTIRSDDTGIYMYTAASLLTIITNTATGIITGAKHWIEANAGRISLTNHGKILGGVLDNAGARDAVVNTGKIQGRVDLGGGKDLFNGTGGTSGPVFGGDGNDRLIGGSHNDALHGGNGNDMLTGGPGSDRFYFDTSLDAFTNVDSITDFRPGGALARIADKIVLSEAYFPGLGPHGTLAAGHFHVGPTAELNVISYSPGSGFLYYHSNDGTTHFATLTTQPTLHNTDFIVTA